MKSINAYINKYPFLIPLVAWFIVNIYSFYSKGIWTIHEATRYIAQSDALMQNNYFTDDAYILYGLPISLMAISKYIDGHYFLFVALQYALSITALYCLFQTIKRVSTLKAALVSTTLYALCLQINEYNSYVYTDSLFISLSVIGLYFLINFLNQKQNKQLIAHIFVCFLLLFTRPTSFPLVFGFISVLFFYFLKQGKLFTKVSISLVLLLAFGFLINKVMALGNMFDFLLPFTEGRIICGIQTPVPSNLNIPTTTNPILGILQFIFQNPIYFLKTVFQKAIAFFSMYRQHYSMGHNLLNILYFYPIFILGFIGISTLIKTKKLIGLALLLPILFTFCTIVISCDDWGNRFILPLISFFIIGMAYKIQKWFA